jgi:hypothetical protein
MIKSNALPLGYNNYLTILKKLLYIKIVFKSFKYYFKNYFTHYYYINNEYLKKFN